MPPIVFHLADKHMEEGLRAFFRRNNWHFALGCRRFPIDPESTVDIFRVAGATDPILWKQAGANLRTHLNTHERAVVVLDEFFDPFPGAEQIRKAVAASMQKHGWPEDRFAVIVIQPMLEAWLFADAVSTARGFNVPDFRQIQQQLIRQKLWQQGAPKPHEMKQARNVAARIGGRTTGSSIFRAVFQNLSSRAFDACGEPGFQLLRNALQTWFPPEGTAA
jgi:hypothetical protein